MNDDLLLLKEELLLAKRAKVIAEEKLAHKTQELDKMQETADLFRRVVENSPEMVMVYDFAGKVIFANERLKRRFRDSVVEFDSRVVNILDLFVESDEFNLNAVLFNKSGVKSKRLLVEDNAGCKIQIEISTSPVILQDYVYGIQAILKEVSGEQNRATEENEYLTKQRILSSVSMSYASLSDFRERTNSALETLGRYFAVSRVYIFEDSEDGLYTRNTYEWCVSGVEPQQDTLGNVAYANIPNWKKLLDETGQIICPSETVDLPKGMKTLFKIRQVKSVLVLPLVAQGERIGFIGFDECFKSRIWHESEIELLRTIANIFSTKFLRQKLENELVKKEYENRIIIDSIPDLILHVSGDGRVKKIKSSETFEKNQLVENVNESDIKNVLNRKLIPRFEYAINECIERGEYKFEFKHLNWNDVIYCEARLVKLLENDVMVIVRDLTHIKEQQKALEEAKNKAEGASRMKSEFLANVSHELKTPLNAILGFSQWLYENTSVQQHKGYLNTIIKSGRGLLHIINDILDISKLESDTLDIDFGPMSYREVVSDIGLCFQEALKEKGINFEIVTDETVPDSVLMDDLRFYQVLFNLVNNAVKFTHEGRVKVRALASKASKEGAVNLLVNIEDTGIGIDKDKQGVIFEAFTQQNGQPDRNYEGTGLGLAIVNGLLQKLNGKLELKSEVGKGSVFSVTFFDVMIDKSDLVQKRKKQEKRKLNLEACSIMIIDDIEYNIAVLKALINSEKVNYIEACDGASALELLKNVKPDIIFMDLRMPGMDGFELIRIIKQNKLLKTIPVVAFSASTLKSKKELLKYKFDDFLQKPVFRKELDEILKRFLPYYFEELHHGNTTPDNVDFEEKVVQQEEVLELIGVLERIFIPRWQSIKDNLVIYEIESFKSDLEKESSKSTSLKFYCDELNVGLQTFDIEIIERKLKEFPLLIESMRLVLEE